MSLSLLKTSKYIHDMELPAAVKLVEVGPRDGLQNLPGTVSLEDKVALINRLSNCGFSAIETGSFVSPQRIPQMAESERVYQQIQPHQDIEYIMLVANERGLQRAITCQAKNIAVFCAATDAFSLKNINCTVSESLAKIKSICQQARAQNMSIRAYISCVLGCPYQGDVDLNRICQLAAALYAYGCYEIALGDTIGVGTPGRVMALLDAVKQAIPDGNIAVHFHDTYGQALANILAALQAGIRIVDCAIGGLGGCPYAPGAAGNVASEDVVYMLNGLGIKTGIDLDHLLATSWFIADRIQRYPTAKVALASAVKR